MSNGRQTANHCIIKKVTARKILDSRGNWTIEVDIVTGGGFGRCSAPSGASTGKFEAVSFPRGSIDAAVAKARALSSKLVGVDSREQASVDAMLKEEDGTESFSNIGGNTAVAVSIASAKAAASSSGVSLYRHLSKSSAELPFPLGNIIGGGVHAKNNLDIQEFLVIPVGAKSIAEAVNVNSEVHKEVKKKMIEHGITPLGKGDEGAWSPNMSNSEALAILSKASERVSDEEGVEVRLGLDVAASVMWHPEKKKYAYKGEGAERSTGEQIKYIKSLIDEYNLYYVEDPIEENDFDGFAELSRDAECLICGDDLYVTNVERIEKGIKKKATSAVLIKPNQCGTLTDTIRAIKKSKSNGLVPVISHRSGETTDDYIAHLSVAFGCPIIKTGVAGGERTAKLNELIRISEEDKNAKMAHLPNRRN